MTRQSVSKKVSGYQVKMEKLFNQFFIALIVILLFLVLFGLLFGRLFLMNRLCGLVDDENKKSEVKVK